MGRATRTTLEIIIGETFAYSFPPITDDAMDRLFEIVGYTTGGSNVWKFRGDCSAYLASGAKFRVEQNGDPDSCKEYTSAGAAYASGITSVTVTASAVPTTATDYGFGRRLDNTPVNLSTDTLTARIEDSGGTLQVAPTVTGNSSGVVSIAITAANTATLTAGRYSGDVKRVTTAPATSFPHAFDVLIRGPIT
jgi:hypothetical protein